VEGQKPLQTLKDGGNMSHFEEKRTVTTSFQLLDEGDSHDKFNKLRDAVNSAWEKIPDEHKNNTFLERIIEEDYDGYSVIINCYYTREETDDEYNKRVVDLNAIKGTQEEAEMEMYFRLKRKYENL